MEELEVPTTHNKSDEEILTESITHPSVFALLVRKYEERFLRKAMSIVKDKADAQDIVQETFTKVYLHANRFKKYENAQFSSWAYRILINTALSYYQKQKRRSKVTVKIDEELLYLIPDTNLSQFKNRELEDEIASILSKMSPLFARVLTLFYIQGLSQAEVAKHEGVSVAAIKTRVHRAKHEFRKFYNDLVINNI